MVERPGGRMVEPGDGSLVGEWLEGGLLWVMGVTWTWES